MEIQANLSEARHVKNSEHFLPQPEIFCSGVAGTRKTPSGGSGSLNLASIRVVVNSLRFGRSLSRQNPASRVPPVSRVGLGEALHELFVLVGFRLNLRGDLDHLLLQRSLKYILANF